MSTNVAEQNRLMTLPEVADFLRVSVKTVRRLIDEGKLRSIKVRGAIRIWHADMINYLGGATA